MTRCPRCHSTMIWQEGGVAESNVPMWHCLGCGQQIRDENEPAVPDEQQVEHSLRERYEYWTRVIAEERK